MKQSNNQRNINSKSQNSTQKTRNIQPTPDEYTLFIPVTENQKNVKLYNKEK